MGTSQTGITQLVKKETYGLKLLHKKKTTIDFVGLNFDWLVY